MIRVPALLVSLAFVACAAQAQQAELFESCEDPQLQAIYRDFIEDVRCLTCLNRNIAESDTPLAHDLRREIRERICAGEPESDVREFLRARYGNFVLYNPPLDATTIMLWAAPFILLLVGAVVFFRVVRTRMRQPIEDDPIEGDPIEEDDEELKA